MADLYVYNAGSNTAPYDTWAKAATTPSTAAAASAAGDDIWIASDHSAAESVTIVFPGTAASPNRCISVSRAGSTPPVAADIAAGAIVSSTAANHITIGGHVYCYGITFNVGSTGTQADFKAVNSAGNHQIFDTCAINIVGTNTAARVTFLQTSGLVEFINTTFSFAVANQGITALGSFVWRNKPGSVGVTGATIPTNLIVTNANSARLSATISGVDLSASGSGKTLFGATGLDAKIINCKINASVTVAATPTQNANNGVDLIGCHSTTNAARNERYRYAGILTTETTIKRTAGASDGTTAFTWKVVTTANAKRAAPFETFEGAVWNTSTGSSKTLTVHTVTDNVTLTDAEIWVEVEYLGSSATPVATLITDANATVLTTAANQTSDSGEAWTTTGLTTPVKQALAVTFTPQMIGTIRWKVMVAKASTTVYIDPNVDVA